MTDARRIAALLLANDPAAADEIDKLADELRGLAARLRSQAAAGGPPASPGGAVDRVRMQVRGPGGELKHDTDSGD